jgi:hypothetical protein
MKLKSSLPLLAGLLLAAPAAAQQRAATFEPLPAPSLSAGPMDRAEGSADADPRGTPTARLAARSVSGGLGMAGGALALGALGYAIDRGVSGDGEWSGVGGLVLGGIAGGMLGTGLGAALPDYEGRCSFGVRFGRAMLGASGGLLAGGVVASLAPASGLIIAVPAGVILGAARAADC